MSDLSVFDSGRVKRMHVVQRGRFAPSPTGQLHLGNARTALLAWLWARSEGGGFTLRMEDLDRPRVLPGLAAQQLDELRWLGLDWDEGPGVGGARGPYLQSERTNLYERELAQLSAEVYECFCSRAEIAASASAPNGPQDDGPRYPGTCAVLNEAQRSERRRTRRPALRLRVPPGEVKFHDEIQGAQSIDPHAQIGDFVLRRADGIHSYQLAVVVDDAAMGVTQVLRGKDLLASTARQIVLHRMLGNSLPRWAHAPLVLEPGGARLAKRDRAASLSQLRARGVDPSQLVALLAQTVSGSSGKAAPLSCTPADLVPSFRLGDVPREAGPLAVLEGTSGAAENQ